MAENLDKDLSGSDDGLINTKNFPNILTAGLTANDLNNFQQDGIDYLYGLEPAQNNLFWAGDFSCHNADNDGKSLSLNRFTNSQFRIKSINFDTPKFTFQEHKQTHNQLIKGIEYSNNMSITWIEDVYHSVRKYHLDWQSHWYNRQFDCLRCGSRQKLRGLNIVLFHYVADSNGSWHGTPVAVPIMVFKIRGMVPLSTGQFKFDTSDAGAEMITINYVMQKIHMFYLSDLMMPDNLWLTERSKEDGKTHWEKIPKEMWNPKSFIEYDGGDIEGSRIIRAATQTLLSEGVLI